MIQIVFGKQDRKLFMSARGHAQSAEHGKDLVCAAVTMLTYTLGQTVMCLDKEGKLERNPVISILSGDADISMLPAAEYQEECGIAMRVIQCGAECLAANYPENVRVNYIGYSNEL